MQQIGSSFMLIKTKQFTLQEKKRDLDMLHSLQLNPNLSS